MGRTKPSPEGICKRAEANGYSYRAYHEEDIKEDSTTYVPKSIKDQRYILDRYEVWVAYIKRKANDSGLPYLDNTISVDASDTVGP